MIAVPIRGRDAEARLARAVQLHALAANLAVAVEGMRARPWVSATFQGTQVSLSLAAPRAPTLGRWLADLPLADLPMRGFLLASLALDRIEDDGCDVRADVTALVIEE